MAQNPPPISARITVLAGPAQSGKTERLLARYRTCLVEKPLAPVLWISPTWRAAAEVRGRLLDGTLPGCFRPGIVTFEKYAESVLQTAGLPIHPMTRLMKRALVRQLIDEQAALGRLKHFRPIAQTSGLVDLFCEFISELKRLEIWPEEFLRACTSRGIADKDTELLGVYQAYQQALQERNLYDAEGRFWSARDVLRKTPVERRPMELVVVDGFTDFTRTQHEIIAILAEGAKEVWISLPLEPAPRRTDLFAKPLRTLAELQRRHPKLAVEEIARAPHSSWPTMAQVEQSLFVNPRTQAAATSKDGEIEGIEILAAARQEGEIDLIGATIKRLLVDGLAKPNEIAVVFRSPQDAGSLVGEVFARLGIPAVLEMGQTLDRSPALRAFVRLLQLDLNDWPFDELLAVVRSNYFQPDEHDRRNGRGQGKVIIDVEQTIRRLQIPHGREKLLAELRRQIAAPDPEATGGKAARRAAAERAASAATLAVLQRLAKTLDAMPKKAILADWAKAWQRLASQSGLLHAMLPPHETAETGNETVPAAPNAESMLARADRLAWNRLMEALAADDTLARWLEQRPLELDRQEAIDALVDILGSERIGHAGDESGCVRILSAASARSLQIPFLFLAGLSERAFPPSDREDRLYGDADYVRLIEAGLPLVARSERNREEMLLFYEAVTRATRRLYLSYPALDDSAQPLSPSPYLREVEQACGGRVPRTEWADLSPVPRDEEPLSARDFRVKAVATALAGNIGLLAGLMREAGCVGEKGREAKDRERRTPHGQPCLIESSLADNIAAGLQMNYLRQDHERFSAAEGLLQSRTAGLYLASRFPQQHPFSATELEQYASCPFRFFLERVLEIEPLEDLTLEVDALQRGGLMHDVLASFHQRVNKRFGGPTSPLKLEPAEFDQMLASALTESFPQEPANPVQAALQEVNRRLVMQWLGQYRAQYEKYEQQWQDCEKPLAPECFEVSFGRGDVKPPSTDSFLEVYCRNDVVRITGRIDRIDTGVIASHTVFNILDYKTGGPIRLTPQTVRDGLTLQLPLYAIAAMDLILTDRDAVAWQAGYWYLREGGYKARQAIHMYRNDGGRIELEREWEDIRDSLAETVGGLVQGIRSGRFAVCSAEDRCTGYCPFHTVCRINQVRSLEKTCRPSERLP